MKTKHTYKIAGMHCASCAMLIEGELEDRGIFGRCSFAAQTVEVEAEPSKKLDDMVKQAVAAAGYSVKE